MFSSFHVFLSCLQSEQMDRLLFAAASEDIGAGDHRSSLQSASLPFLGLLKPEPKERMLLRSKGRQRAVRIPLKDNNIRGEDAVGNFQVPTKTEDP